jgi:hypothetical protein
MGMHRWTRRLRGALGMGLTWAIAWALAGILIGVASLLLPGRLWNAFFSVFDAPLPALAIPGFVGGALFSLVLGIAARHRRFDELSLARVTTWGAVGGLLLALVPAMLVVLGLASVNAAAHSLLGLTLIIACPLILLCALSAAGSLLLARRTTDRGHMELGATDEHVSLLDGAAPVVKPATRREEQELRRD